jgi:cell surface protein SprA
VNYQLGVQILDPALQASNTINVSLENNIFGQQTRRFMGVNVEHKISDNFLVGATFLKCLRPFTQKSSFGQSQLTILFLDSTLIFLQKFLS